MRTGTTPLAQALLIGGLLFTVATPIRGANAEILTSDQSNETISRLDIVRWLGASGIDAESLTAAGLTAGEVQPLIARVRNYLAANLTSLNQLQVAAAAAAAKVSKPEGESASLDELKSFAASAKAAREAAVDSLFEAAMDDVASDVQANLRNIRTNRAQGLPTKYLVATRTSAEWSALRNAISASGDAQRRGETIPSDAQEILDAANENQAVAAASTRLTSNLVNVRANWTAALVSS